MLQFRIKQPVLDFNSSLIFILFEFLILFIELLILFVFLIVKMYFQTKKKFRNKIEFSRLNNKHIYIVNTPSVVIVHYTNAFSHNAS